jgi:uncharacterized membrane protein
VRVGNAGHNDPNATMEAEVRQGRRLAGVGAIAFVVSLVGGFTLFGPKGGAYSAGETAAFVGQSPSGIIVSIHMFAVSIIGLIVLMAYLSANSCRGARQDRIVWGTSLAAAASFLIGWGLYLAPSTSLIAGGPAIDPAISYTFISAGFVVLFGVGDVLLGIALLTLATRGVVLPIWVRAFSALAGLSAIFSWAFLLAWGWSPNQWLPVPFYLVVLWGLVIGIWLLVSSPSSDATLAVSG